MRSRPRVPLVRAVVAALGLAACGQGDGMSVAPVIDVPQNDEDATASPLDDIALSVAHAGNDRDLVTQTFLRGEALALSGIPFGDDLVMHMSGFVGASNVAYGRTCAFAISSNVTPTAPHLFFSRIVKFANVELVPVSPVARSHGFGVSYLGAAMFLGGDDVAVSSGTQPVELYDPVTNLLSTIGQLAPHPRGAVALIGNPSRVVVVGGASISSGPRFIEVIDRQAIDRIEFADLARRDLTATALTDGRVIVIGGFTLASPSKPAEQSAEIDELTSAENSVLPHKLGATLATGRSGHTATRLGDDVGAPVLIAGGMGPDKLVASAELFRPLSDEVTGVVTNGSMIVPRQNHTAVRLPDGRVLIIGGTDAMGVPVRQLETFSLDGGFQASGSLPDDAALVDFAVTTLPDGRILISGGRASSDSTTGTTTTYIIRLDPLNGQVDVVATDHLALLRYGHQTAALCDGTVLISGGTNVAFQPERYNPPPAGRR